MALTSTIVVDSVAATSALTILSGTTTIENITFTNTNPGTLTFAVRNAQTLPFSDFKAKINDVFLFHRAFIVTFNLVDFLLE